MACDRRGERQAGLRRRLADAGVDALVVTHPPNIRYLCGFSGSAGFLVVRADRAILITDSRYRTQARTEAAAAADVEIEPANLWDRLKSVLAGLSAGTLAFERDHLTIAGVERLRDATPARLEGAKGWVEALRVAKSAEEVALIRAAGALALEALDAVLPSIRTGESELTVAARLESALRLRGSEWHPFPTIVASGPNAALPHARPGPRPIEPGDLLLLDFGAQVGGYCADLSRTVVVGRAADGRQREVYAAVRDAQAAALSGLRVSMTGREADALARDHLTASGFGEAFAHSLGHGLGLEVHEDPRLAPTAGDPLPLHAVVTVEPGVYLEGWGGVRLEDDVLLTIEGPARLTPGAPDLVAVP